MKETSSSSESTDLLSLPYRDRQVIVTVKQVENYHKQVPISLSDYYSDEVHEANRNLKNWLKLSHYLNTKTWGVHGYLFDKIRGVIGDSDNQGIKHFRKLQANIAEEILTLPPGHPLYDTVYIGHPLKTLVYVPLANFHRFLFEEKFNELMKLFSCLGAEKIGISYVSGYREAFEASGSVALPVDVPVQIQVSAKGAKEGVAMADLEAHFEPTAQAYIPEGLVWYPYETTWQQIAEGRLKGGLKKIDVALRYEDDFGVSGELATGLESMKLKIGGDFQKHEKTTWKFHGTFR